MPRNRRNRPSTKLNEALAKKLAKLITDYEWLVRWIIIDQFRVPLDDAEDVMQECWMAIWKNIANKRTKTDEGTKKWIARIATSKARDYYRRRRLPMADGGGQGQLDFVVSCTEPEPPLADAIRNEYAALVRISKDSLDGEMFTLATLSFEEGMSLQKIADKLGSAKSTINKWRKKAREKLLNRLDYLRDELPP